MAVQSTAQVPQNILSALKKASAVTGADFNYLVNTAARESGFRPGVKAPTSSATGLFQFIDSTWLQMMKDEGPSLGLGDYAKHITRNKSGRYTVQNSEKRQEILNLRKNPDIASLMAGAFTRFNSKTLESEIGRKPTSGELYIAHFLGAGSGAKLINAANLSPNSKAVDLFPAAARSNKTLFYRGGQPVSVKGLYQNLVKRHHVQQVEVAGIPPLPHLKPAGMDGLSPGHDTDLGPLPYPLRGDEIKAAALRATIDLAKADAQSHSQNGEDQVADAPGAIVGGIYNHLDHLATQNEKSAAGLFNRKSNGPIAVGKPAEVASLDGAIGVWDVNQRVAGGLQHSGRDRLATNLEKGVRPILETGNGARGLFMKGGLGSSKS